MSASSSRSLDFLSKVVRVTTIRLTFLAAPVQARPLNSASDGSPAGRRATGSQHAERYRVGVDGPTRAPPPRRGRLAPRWTAEVSLALRRWRRFADHAWDTAPADRAGPRRTAVDRPRWERRDSAECDR